MNPLCTCNDPACRNDHSERQECRRCHGEGAVESSYIGSVVCPTCKGIGSVEDLRPDLVTLWTDRSELFAPPLRCRRCGAEGADSQRLCWDCVQVRAKWLEQMQRDKINAAKIGWPEFPEDCRSDLFAPPVNDNFEVE